MSKQFSDADTAGFKLSCPHCLSDQIKPRVAHHYRNSVDGAVYALPPAYMEAHRLMGCTSYCIQAGWWCYDCGKMFQKGEELVLRLLKQTEFRQGSVATGRPVDGAWA